MSILANVTGLDILMLNAGVMRTRPLLPKMGHAFHPKLIPPRLDHVSIEGSDARVIISHIIQPLEYTSR